PQAALLRLAEVVRAHHPGDHVLQVHGDASFVRVPGDPDVRRVDHLDLGVALPGAGIVVELLLHTGDVRVGLLDGQPGPGAEVGDVADVAVHHDHLLLGDVVVLELRQPRVLLAGDRLAVGHAGVVRDDERRTRAARGHLRLDVHVAELGDAA